MGADAIVMMIVAVLVVWGGLALAIGNLVREDADRLQREMHRDL